MISHPTFIYVIIIIYICFQCFPLACGISHPAWAGATLSPPEVRIFKPHDLTKVAEQHCHDGLSWNGYGSIPIDTIFRGMNIHKSQLFWCELQGYKVLTHCHGLLPFCWGYLEGLLGISFFKVNLLRWLSDPFWGSVTSNWWFKRSLWRTRYMVPYG